MIGRIITGKSFKGVISYCLSPKNGIDRAEIIDYNLCFGSKQELIKQFNDVSKLNTRLHKPVFHFILSWPNTDNLDNNKVRELSKSLADEFGFNESQYLVIRHYDTEEIHPHIHIIANRQNLTNNKTVSDSNSYERIAKFCRRIEIKNNLTIVKSPDKFLPKEERGDRHDERKAVIQQKIKQALMGSQTIPQFNEAITKLGISCEIARGITFYDDKIRIKGSDLGFSLERIKSKLKENILNELSIEQHNKQLNIGI
jgi:Relaxase/Mobilisation nuclease domain.